MYSKKEYNDNNINFNNIAIMIETGENTNLYNLSNVDSFPTEGYALNLDKSYCENGSLLSYKAGHVKIDLNGNDKCYTYFDVYTIPTVNSVALSNVSVTSFTITANTTEGSRPISRYYFSIDNGATYVNSETNSYTFVVSNVTATNTYSIKAYAVDDYNYDSNVKSQNNTIYRWGKYTTANVVSYVENSSISNTSIEIAYDGASLKTYYNSSKMGYNSSTGKYSGGSLLTIGSSPSSSQQQNACDLLKGKYVIPIGSYVGVYDSRYMYYIPTDAECHTSDYNTAKDPNTYLDGNFTVYDGQASTSNKLGMGTYIEDVASLSSGAYPSNNYSGSYWYVKK